MVLRKKTCRIYKDSQRSTGDVPGGDTLMLKLDLELYQIFQYKRKVNDNNKVLKRKKEVPRG